LAIAALAHRVGEHDDAGPGALSILPHPVPERVSVGPRKVGVDQDQGIGAARQAFQRRRGALRGGGTEPPAREHLDQRVAMGGARGCGVVCCLVVVFGFGCVLFVCFVGVCFFFFFFFFFCLFFFFFFFFWGGGGVWGCGGVWGGWWGWGGGVGCGGGGGGGRA